MNGVRTRPAVPRDADALATIYSHHILHGTGTFEEEPVDAAEMERRLAAVTARGWPWLVADEDGGAVIGYAYAARFRDRAAYRYTGETSLYVAADAIGRGVGNRLLAALIVAARACGFRRLVAVIGDSANASSIGLHRKHGFGDAGKIDAAGRKFGRDLDVILMQRAIAGEESE